jgi:AAA domain
MSDMPLTEQARAGDKPEGNGERLRDCQVGQGALHEASGRNSYPVRDREWIVPGILPLGGTVLLAANANQGKTPTAYHCLACVTAGKDFTYDLLVATSPMKTLLFNGEGDIARDVNPRLIAAGVDAELITVFDCVVERPDITFQMIPDIVKQHPDVGFVVVDPLTAFCDTGTPNPYRVRKMLAPFHKLASERNITFLFVHHTTKNRSARHPLGLISGSKGWTDNVCTVWQIEPCNPDGDAILEMTKGRNVARPFPRFEFWIEATEVPGVRDPVPCAVVGDPAEMTITELMRLNHPTLQLTRRDQALSWLRDYLEHGPRLMTDVECDGEAAGHTLVTLRRAKKVGGIEDRKREGDGKSEWFLPQVEQEDQALSSSDVDQVDQVDQVADEEHYTTDKRAMDAIHEVCGIAELDPASPPRPVHVQCRRWFTKADDGLAQSWLIPKDGWLFLNPPWDAPRGEPKPIPLWVDKLVAEIGCGNVPRAIVLLPFRMSQAFEKLLDAGAAVLNFGRLKFGGHNNTHREDTACLIVGFDHPVPQRIVEEAHRNGLTRAKALSSGNGNEHPPIDGKGAAQVRCL